ncbi:hypothetical protein N0V88_007989 [Collariella sp. IMI 366227]|nr:hypothetical protein N0V88_007989 [Collariella sp. IMI 366227]
MLGGENASQRPATSTPTQSHPGVTAPVPAPMPGYAPPTHNPYPPQPAYQHPPQAYSYPQPSASGSIDLSAIRPVNSGTVPLADAIAKAKAYAAEKGVTPYDRPPQAYPDQHQSDARHYQRPRSKSPRGRESFRDNFNPYRDERRAEHGGQGRDFGRDRSYSPGRGRPSFSPRGGHGGRDRLVGLIIGRQGENLRRVESESRCRVQFIPATNPNDPLRLCRITGPRAQREQAREMINHIIQDSGMRGGQGGGGGGDRPREGGRGPAPPPVPKEGEDSVQIMVPDRTVGLIIGRGGETIRDLQERSGCHINIVSENKSVNGLRPVNLIGAPAAARHAKELILEIVDSDSRNGNNQANARPPRNEGYGGGGGGGGGPDKVNDSIYVPSDAVGMIIGKGGETIREMQNITGCKINVSQSSGPGETEREIGLVGSRDSIVQAKRAIEDKVDAARQKSAGGGGGRGRGGQHRDFDNPNYGQPSNQSSAPPNMSSGGAAPAAAGGNQADPYAMYGGYENYIALWWQSQLAAQQAQGGGSQPPGTS